MKSWDDLTENQQADVSSRFENYLRVYLRGPLPPEIYIPILPDPRDPPIPQAGAPAASEPMRKAVFRRVVYPNNHVDYKFSEIQ